MQSGLDTSATERAQWRSRSGFILAALGAAIGIGNLWRFSYVMGENGGGALLAIYLVAVLLIGLPMMLGELAFGRTARREAATAFASNARGALWSLAGLPGVIAAFSVLTYYGLISGWAFKYFAEFAVRREPPAPGAALGRFEAFIGHSIDPLMWGALAMAVAVAIVAVGVDRGIERASKLLMPVLALIVVALALHSLTLPGAGQALTFLFAPDWSAFSQPKVYLAALGQAFFSLGLAMGVLVTYGSYLPRDVRLPAAALTIAVGDTLFAIIAAVVIFPAVFSFGMNPGQGPGLAFVTLPEIFARMAGGHAAGIAFFGLLVVAALTSLVALIEIPVAYAIERWAISRRRAAVAVGLAAFVLSVPSSLGFGFWSTVRIGGMPILDAVDFTASNVLLPLSGLAVAVYLGWHWPEADAVSAAGFRRAWLARLWLFSIRYVAPAMILIVLLRSLPVR